ncbi:hypothetical protein SODALDRAFT_354177 [Sodiomyces alkalinus F11]|uniref:FAR1 domain-containing protein n=1 Tax=Sodiomyces alkalinus (strain CBS 110278 / VKM F-3762 / F11) TaxID=1314773 RepID=A0A3N2Q5K8_SODAK|nr:hypothetical protein SODALDRAFT_354177 [Sodiomyces alkalinus F11]ROT42059.1 hypothetical protein SODALDRAFT_354177 [Sodiomyces alkalinus F11]
MGGRLGVADQIVEILEIRTMVIKPSWSYPSKADYHVQFIITYPHSYDVNRTRHYGVPALDGDLQTPEGPEDRADWNSLTPTSFHSTHCPQPAHQYHCSTAHKSAHATSIVPPLFPQSHPDNTAKLDSSVAMPNSPPPALLPPPEGIFRNFEDLLSSVQRVAKDQGYGVVKLRASNYRDGKPTRYDLVCDRGGVKYSSTAKKRNPSTRKVDCPWRAKAVCEVQLGNQWRFAVQESRHNHEPRIATAPPGQENTPLAQSMRSFTNKIDRLSHDMAQGFIRIEQALDNLNKRLENLENRTGGYEPRFQNMESRLQGVEARGSGMELPMDDVDARLLQSGVMPNDAVGREDITDKDVAAVCQLETKRG